MGLTTKINNGTFTYENTTASDSSGTVVAKSTPQSLNFIFPDGILAGQANKSFAEPRTLSGASYTYTLSALTGAALAKLKLILILVSADSTGSLAVAQGDTNPFTKFTASDLRAGSIALETWPALQGAAVASGSADKLKFTATGAVNYLVFFIGTDA